MRDYGSLSMTRPCVRGGFYDSKRELISRARSRTALFIYLTSFICLVAGLSFYVPFFSLSLSFSNPRIYTFPFTRRSCMIYEDDWVTRALIHFFKCPLNEIFQGKTPGILCRVERVFYYSVLLVNTKIKNHLRGAQLAGDPAKIFHQIDRILYLKEAVGREVKKR